MRQTNTPPITREELLRKYTYDPRTGALTRNWDMGRYPKGGQVGKCDAKGNRVLRFKFDEGHFGMIALGRLIWFIVTGTLPNRYVRFRDGDNTNFAANNLYLGRAINTPENIAKNKAKGKH